MTTSRQKAVGSAGERRVAGLLKGRRIGQDGGPVDVIVDGYLSVQVKTVATLPSLNVCRRHIDAIPKGPHIRASVIMQRQGSGHPMRGFVVMDLDEFSEWHGAVEVSSVVLPMDKGTFEWHEAMKEPMQRYMDEAIEAMKEDS